LTVIQGSASALTDPDTGGDANVRNQLLRNILEGSARLNGIVENLLSINRLESGLVHLNLRSADPVGMTETAVAQCGPQLRDHPVTIGENPPGRLVRCDEVLVIQVIRNILVNAARYAPPDSAIAVGLEPDEAGKSLWFVIKDSGPGLPEDELGLVFNKFWRGKNAGSGGTGLGLAICKGIVESHGGQIKAIVPPEGGLTVSFSLPLAEVRS
jgi:two-component system sensor histidine kinase KdpD